MADTQYSTFSEVRARLDEIVVEVRKKDLSLEKSLDLYEEAIQLGNRCAELVDKPDYTLEEAQAAKELLASSAPDLGISGQAQQKQASEKATDSARTAEAVPGDEQTSEEAPASTDASALDDALEEGGLS